MQYSRAMAAYPPASGAPYPPAAGPSSRIELRISCKGLRRTDLLSKSDPIAVVYTCSPYPTPGRVSWEEVSSDLSC